MATPKLGVERTASYMTELSGTLQGLGLPAIIRFLGGLKKTGCLRIAEHGWEGELFFEEGQLREARLGTRTGLAVLDALVETFSNGSFVFDSQAIFTGEPAIRLSPQALEAHLDEMAARVTKDRRLLPRPDAVLAIRSETEGDAHDEPLALDRGTLQTLLAIDGTRSVRQLVAQRGSFDVLWHLATLTEAGLVERVSAPASPEPVAETPRRMTGDTALLRALAAEPEPTPTPPVAAVEPAPSKALQPVRVAAGHCHNLGFADDSSSSFDRPTRLHRCFAASTPMPLSLDQQRELCLTDEFRTCPRLTTVAPSTTEADESRIVRLPLAARQAQPRPLHERVDRATAAHAAAPAFAASRSGADVVAGARALLTRPVEPDEDDDPAPYPQSWEPMQAQLDELVQRPTPTRRLPIILGVALVALAVAALLYGVSGAFRGRSVDSSIDPVIVDSSISTDSVEATATSVQPVVSEAATVVVPTPVATAVPAPTVVAQASAPKLLFNDYFSTNAGWPSSPDGAASIINGTYRVAPAHAGQFVAIGAPITNLPADVIVDASFHKLGGPSGGGYGLIVRDQSTTPRDGNSQDGHYYVAEVGDKGDVGMWRRDGDHWVDLLAWQASDAVKPNSATNELTVRAVGNTLTLLVNGVQVTTRTDSTFTAGGVGLFVGGDGNQVAVDHFSIQTP